MCLGIDLFKCIRFSNKRSVRIWKQCCSLPLFSLAAPLPGTLASGVQKWELLLPSLLISPGVDVFPNTLPDWLFSLTERSLFIRFIFFFFHKVSYLLQSLLSLGRVFVFSCFWKNFFYCLIPQQFSEFSEDKGTMWVTGIQPRHMGQRRTW